MKRFIFLIVLLPVLLLACTSDGNSSSEPEKPAVTKKYHVTYETSHGTAPVDTNEYSEGDKVTLPDFDAKYCSDNTLTYFRYWTVDGNDYRPGDTFTIKEDTTFTATFSSKSCEVGCDSTIPACLAVPQKYHVTYVVDFGTAPIDSNEYSEGETVTLKDMNYSFCEGDILKTFSYWDYNGTQYQPGSSFIINNNTTFTAVFESVDCSAVNGLCVVQPDGCAVCGSN